MTERRRGTPQLWFTPAPGVREAIEAYRSDVARTTGANLSLSQAIGALVERGLRGVVSRALDDVERGTGRGGEG